MSYSAERGTVQRRTYWAIPQKTTSRSLKETVEEADALLGEAVAEELVSDVPVGVFLSGGIDSSLVATYATKASPHMKSFCADFVGWSGSELEDSRIVATHLDTVHNVCSIDRLSSVLTNRETEREFFQVWDEPLGDPAILPTWKLSKLTREHVTVALSGDGGDEMFAGYTPYAQVQATLRRKIAWYVESSRRKLGLGREWPDACESDCEFYQFLHCPSFSRTELTCLFPDWQRDIDEAVPGRLFNDIIDRNAAPFRRWQLVDMQT